MVNNIFLQISVLLGITVTIAFIIRLLRQPLIIAYIVAGIVAGPLFLNLVHGSEESFRAFAEFGVVLLLFVVGLSLNFHHIRQIGRVAIKVGLVQFGLTVLAGWFLLRVLGLDFFPAFYLAIGVTFSSTIIIIKLLSEKKDLETVYGRYTIGLLLVQDVIAILLMLLITSASEASVSLLETLGFLFLKAGILVAVIYFLARVVVPPVLDRVAHSAEFLFLFTVAWCLGIASFVHWFGFSLEIGAVLAGISLGSSPYSREISSRIKPLRDFFLVLFFIILGSEMTLADFHSTFFPSLVLALFILVIQPIILYALFRMVKFTRRNSFLIGLTAAQVSEFGFILLFVAEGAGLVGRTELTIMTMVALITIFFSSYLITYNEQIYRWCAPWFSWFGKDDYQQAEETEEVYDVWVVGYHRIGWKICEALARQKVRFAVIDYNPEAVAKLRSREIPAYFGDVADVEFLATLPLHLAKMVISTILESDDQATLVRHMRTRSKKCLIITNLHHSLHIDELYAAGADYVLMPHLLTGSWVAEVLKHKPWNKKTFQKLRREQREAMKLNFSYGQAEKI